MRDSKSVRTYTIADLERGDVVLSRYTLSDLMELMSYEDMYLSGQTWLMAQRLISLMSYIEAFITQRRVLFAVPDDDSIVRNVERDNRFDLEISLLRIPRLWDAEHIKELFDETASVIYISHKSYLKTFSHAEREWNGFYELVTNLLKETNPQLKVEYEPWDQAINSRAFELSIIYSKLRSLGVSFYANALESSFCSPLALSIVSTGVAMRLVEKTRIKHAKKNNQLLGANIFDYDVPFIFGAVLRQSSGWSDLFKVMKEMRETREAQAFRNWSSSLDMDLVNFHRHFEEVEDLSSDLAKGVESHEKQAIRMEYGQRTSVESPFSDEVPRDDLHLVFLQKLFEKNRAIVSIDEELERVIYNKSHKVNLGEKIRELSRGCIVKVDQSSSIKLEMLPLVTESDIPKSDISREGVKYETHIYGAIYGPVHTGSGDITSDFNKSDTDNNFSHQDPDMT